MVSDAVISENVLRAARQNVAAADRAFRATRQGLSTEVIINDFAFHDPLVDLDCAQLRAYAEAVSAGTPFPLPPA